MGGAAHPPECLTPWLLVERNAGEYGDKDTLVTIDSLGMRRRVTHDELASLARRASAGLVAHGVRRGDRVALWSTNIVEWVVSHFACLRIGAVVVPVNTRLQPDEVRYVLRKSQARHLIILDRFQRRGFLELLDPIVPGWRSAAPGELYSDVLPDLRTIIVISRTEPCPEAAIDWKTLIEPTACEGDAGMAATRMSAAVAPADAAVIKFTSGSTGFPKGVVLEHHGLVANGMRHGARLRLTASDRWFSMNPFFHAGGSVWGLMSMACVGGALVFTEVSNGALGVQLLAEERCTVMSASPPMAHDLLDALEKNPLVIDSVRLAAFWGADLVEPMRRAFGVKKFYSHYGMTEVYGPAAVGDPYDGPSRQETWWARPLDGTEVKVTDPDTGAEITSGQGEVHLRGLVSRGYFEDPEATSALIGSDGWVHSQDLVDIDEAGYIRYVGRLKLMIKVGGENVAVEEIERVIRAHELVRETGVIGVPDERYSEVPRAYVLAEPGSSLDETSIRNWCTERLARFKVPRDIVIVNELPMTGSAKVDRMALLHEAHQQ